MRILAIVLTLTVIGIAPIDCEPEIKSETETEAKPEKELSTRLLRWRILREKRHEKLRKFRTNFDIVEMPDHMQTDAIEFATEGLEKYGQDYDEVADHMCRMIEKKYHEVWSCVIGQNFGYSIEEPEPGKFMLFYIGHVNRLRVMAFVPKNNGRR